MAHSVSIMLPIDTGHLLLPIARASIQSVLEESPEDNATPMHLLPKWVHEKGASFVTLTQKGNLRGCIGTLVAHQSLINDVKTNAINAATRDPRFPRLLLAELSDINIELSVLSIPEIMQIKNEVHALEQLRPGIDGIILEWHGYRSTFLPQVWEQIPDATEFLGLLKRKAGLPSDFWAPDLQLSRYTVSKWTEKNKLKE